MTSINSMKLALEVLEAVSKEMTVGERYTNAGRAASLAAAFSAQLEGK